MKSFAKKWKNLLMIPLLCAVLALASGCGGNSAGKAEQISVVEETGSEEQSSENVEAENPDESSGEQSFDSAEGEETGWEDGNDNAGDESYGDDTYSDGSDSEENGWDESDGNGDAAEEDSYSEDSYIEGGDSYTEDGGSQDNDASGTDNGNDYQEEYEGSDGEIQENGVYTTKEDVALYIHTYGKLPANFMTKKQARSMGWSGGSLENYAPGMCIGGDRFGNYEGTLPRGNYHECDINTLGKKKRGAERLIYSDDGRIYYTDDHYETFTLLYE